LYKKERERDWETCEKEDSGYMYKSITQFGEEIVQKLIDPEGIHTFWPTDKF